MVVGRVAEAAGRSKVLQLAQLHGWHLTIDAFASDSNTLLPRFFACYAEPAAESEDAFTVCDWDPCPKCGLAHRETLFAYPPPALLNRFIAKARADGVRAIVVTPLAVSAPYWSKLLRSAIVRNKKGYIRLRSQQNCPPGSPSSPSTSRPTLPAPAPPAPPCGQEAEYRGRLTAGSPHDQAERRSIHEELAAAHLALRPAPHVPSYPPLAEDEFLGT